MDQKLRNKLKKDKKKRAAQKKTTSSSSAPTTTTTTTTTTTSQPKKSREVTFEESHEDQFNLEYEFEDGEEELEQEMNDEEDDDDGDAEHNTAMDEDPSPHTNTVLFRGLTTTNPSASAAAPPEMEHDESAYGMLHRMCFEWPAMSFDFCRDGLGAERSKYPHTVWIVQGTCSGVPEPALNIMRADSLVRTKKTLDDEEEEMIGAIAIDDDDEHHDPELEARSFPHDGGVNRVRVCPHSPGIVATWSDSGRVHLYDVSKSLTSLRHHGSQAMTQGQGGLFYTFAGHRQEGFALDWSRCKSGRLASGDGLGRIHVWDMDTSRVMVDSVPYVGHDNSVEDLQWSPTEESVLASCGTDGTVRIWDTRAPKHEAMLCERVHDVDVNVLSWNAKVSFLLASGSDDCSFKVWDLRNFKSTTPVGWFKNFHTGPITSIEWSPHDESVLCVSSEDDQVTLWDLSLEEDPEMTSAGGTIRDEFNNAVAIPPQLLFVHSGLVDPKEARFHPHIVGLVGATGAEGFDLFISEPLDKGVNVDDEDMVVEDGVTLAGGGGMM